MTVADSNGRMLSNHNKGDSLVVGANNYMDYKTAVEQEMTHRLQKSLELVLAPGAPTVIANASLDMTQETVIRTSYEKGIPMEETIEETSNIVAGAADAENRPSPPPARRKRPAPPRA